MKKKDFGNLLMRLEELGGLIDKSEEKFTKTQQKELFVVMKALYFCYFMCNKESQDKLYKDLDKIGDKYEL